jgi:hypothetical protein
MCDIIIFGKQNLDTLRREISILSSCEVKVLLETHGVYRVLTAGDGLRVRLHKGSVV